MSNVKIIVDSSCDIPQERLTDLDLTLIPLSVVFGDEHYRDYDEMNADKFAALLKQSKANPTTALTSLEEVSDVMRKFIDEGNDIVAATLSSAGSGTFSVFNMAKKALEEEAGHELPIRIIDSRAFTLGHGMPVYDAVRMRDEGAGFNDIADMLEKSYAEGEYIFWALLSDLNFLKRGGRLKAGAAVLGGILGIVPILSVEDGLVVPKAKARGFDKAFEVLLESIEKDFPSKKIQRFAIVHHGIEDKVKKLVALLNEKFELETEIDVVSPHGTIMTHSGANFLAVAYK